MPGPIVEIDTSGGLDPGALGDNDNACGQKACTLSAKEIVEQILGGDNEVLKLEENPDPRADCAEACVAQGKLIDENCKILRLRCQEFLKNKGCPSSIKAYKKPSRGKACRPKKRPCRR